jgi:ribosomal protein S18 acetylase RimI-like enzyme
MQFNIRRLELGDRGGIERALRSDGTFNEDEVSVALELVDDALLDPTSEYQVRVGLSEEGEVAGYICFGPTPMTAATYDLYWVVTHVAARGHGLAAALIQTMEAQIRSHGARAVRVETSQAEAYGSARRLYEKCGYPEQARFPDFYRPGDDLIVFYKRL